MILSPTQVDARDVVLDKLGRSIYQIEAVPCLCGASADQEIAAVDRFGLPVHVQLCGACGLARTSPRLAAVHLGDFYEHDYHPLHFGVRNPSPDMALFRGGQGRAIHELVRDLLPPGPLRVADVGAGTGQVLREFATAHGAVVGQGCEFSSAFVEAGRKAGTDMRHGGPEALDGPFDVVILSHVVEHFPELPGDLAPVRELGHDRTLFYVEVPGLLTIDRKPEYAYRLSEYVTLAHTFHFTLESLTATMARADLRMVRGDETVRSVFVQSGPTSPMPDATLAPRISGSLAGLRSPQMRIRRMRPLARRALGASAKRALPARLVRLLRRDERSPSA